MPLGETEEVSVLVADLRLIDRALTAAYGTSAAWDLLNQYRQLSGRPTKSNLSMALQKASGRVQGYIAEADSIGEPDDDIS